MDALRGIGVIAVVLQHFGETLLPPFARFTTHSFQFGQFGVTVFFFCSGFIVPAMLVRHRSLSSFWLSRLFRLYPLYWASLAAALALNTAGMFPLPDLFYRAPVVAVFGNATMLQTFLGIPHAIGLYWTLAFEMLFYGAISLLHPLGQLKYPERILAGSLVLALAVATIPPLLLGRPGPIGLFNLSFMLLGFMFYNVSSGGRSLRRASIVTAAALGCVSVALATNFLGRDDPSALGSRSFMPMLLAWTAATGVFVAGCAFRSLPVPEWLVFLGRISYSIYLVHPLAMAVAPRSGTPWLTAVLWFAFTLFLSYLTYRFVESPAIRLGRALARRYELRSGEQPGPAKARRKPLEE